MKKTPTSVPKIKIFKTKQFSKKAAKSNISDQELLDAAKELEKGRGDNLGGNVWKKRLDENRHRGIVLTKVGKYWIFVFLFKKSARENIEDDELAAFKALAKIYEELKPAAVEKLIRDGELLEIANGHKKVQK